MNEKIGKLEFIKIQILYSVKNTVKIMEKISHHLEKYLEITYWICIQNIQ